MSSILKTILFNEVPKPSNVSRSIKFDVSDIDIRFSTGTMRERVVGYLSVSREPLTAKEIASGIGSTTSRVYVQLKRLLSDRVIEAISVEGFHPEYEIRQSKQVNQKG